MCDNNSCSCRCNTCCTTNDCCIEVTEDGCTSIVKLECTKYNGDDISALEIVSGATNGDEAIQALGEAIVGLQNGSNDKYVKVSNLDTTAGYLINKIKKKDNSNITITKRNSGINEYLELDVPTPTVETTFVGTNSDGIAYTAGGVHGHSPIYKVKIDPASNGGLTVGSAGLKLVLPTVAAETSLVATDSSTIDFTTSGNAGHNLTAAVKISSNSGNILTNSSGLFVPTPATETNFVASNGQGIDATSGGTHGHSPIYNLKLDPTTDASLTLSNSGLKLTPVAEQNLVVNDSTTIDLAVSGVKNHTLTAAVKISSVGGNSLVDNGGLFVPTPEVETSFVANDSSTIDFTTSGTHGHILTGSVKISASGENALIDSTGLFVQKDKLTPQTLTYGGTTTWNVSLGYNAKLTLTGNTILAITNAIAGQYLTLKVKQDATGSRTITLPAGSKVKSGGSGAVTLTTTANAEDLLCAFYDGVSFYWVIGKNYT